MSRTFWLIARARRCPLRIPLEQLPVILHRGSATGRVGDDAIDAGGLEDLDVVTRQLARLVDVARVQRQRTAAALRARRIDAAPFRGKDANGRLVHIGERDPLHAPFEKRDLHALGPDSRRS